MIINCHKLDTWIHAVDLCDLNGHCIADDLYELCSLASKPKSNQTMVDGEAMDHANILNAIRDAGWN